MARSGDPKRKRKRYQPRFDDAELEFIARPPPQPTFTQFSPKTPNQTLFARAIQNHSIIAGTGPAGTGKTYVATCLALESLIAGKIQRIIVTRPAVEAGDSLGFLPGTLDEKYGPYLAPVKAILEKKIGAGHVSGLFRSKKIIGEPLGFMRGATFDDTWVILDEAQNTTPVQMKLFLTRIGVNCKMILAGDTDQIDIRGECGLTDAVGRLKFRRTPGFAHVEFTEQDCVRSDMARYVLQAYAKPQEPSLLAGVFSP